MDTETAPNTSSRLAWAIVAIMAFTQGVLLYLFRGFAAEDSYILARYVRNAVAGNGLVYNAGERITALTSPAHALIVSALTCLTHAPSATNRGMAVVLLLVTEAAALYSLRKRPISAMLFATVVLACPFVSFWALGGLETIYLMSIVTMLVLLVRSVPSGGRPLTVRSALLASFLLGLGFLTRYDAVLFLAPIALYLLARNPRLAVPLILPGLTMTLAWFAFSKVYYHDIFPTSLYIKPPGLTIWRGLGNLAYEAHFLVLTGALFLLTIRPISLRSALWLLIPLACVAAYGISTATTHMFFGYRLFVPYLPALAILLIDVRQPPTGKPPIARATIPVTLALAANAFSLYWMLTVCIDPRLPFVEADFSPRHRSLAQYNQLMNVLVLNAEDINRHAASHPLGRPPRIATFAGGYLPYHCPDAYVFEALVSYRKLCPLKGQYLGRYFPYADYIHIILPVHGAELKDLAKPFADYEVVSAHKTMLLDQEQTVYVLYNPSSLPLPLPVYVDGRCP